MFPQMSQVPQQVAAPELVSAFRQQQEQIRELQSQINQGKYKIYSLFNKIRFFYLIIKKIEWLRRFLEELIQLLRGVHQFLLEVNLTPQAVTRPDVKIRYRG